MRLPLAGDVRLSDAVDCGRAKPSGCRLLAVAFLGPFPPPLPIFIRMIETLTILMYHYVRDVNSTAFPGIKARSIADFRGQIEYCRRHYRIISPTDLLLAIQEPTYVLPANALLLTFDDGYIDHYQAVFPILMDLHLSAVFAPVGKAVMEGRVLDVNKIHFVLAVMKNRVGRLVEDLFDLLDRYRPAYNLDANQSYWNRLAHANRFDPPEIIFVKRLLQRDLPEELRSRLVDALFRRYVTGDEADFAGQLYMNLAQLREMAQAGMCIASHGYDHHWLGTLPAAQQAEQVRKSLDFLARISTVSAGWMFTYPYGSTDENLLGIAKQRGCLAGFTTEPRIASGQDDRLLLPRLDTNDLPTEASASIAEWTRNVGAGDVR